MPVEKEVAAQEFVQGIKNGTVWVVSISRPIIFDASQYAFTGKGSEMGMNITRHCRPWYKKGL